jgi:glycosyltransferase involved in cell wall biosynthesis
MNSKLKILHLVSSISVGGAERALLEMAEKSDREELEIHICYFGSIRGASFQSDFERLGLPFLKISTSRFYDLKNLTGVIKYIRKYDINIIHTHLIDADILGRIAGALTNRPVITTIQNELRRYNELRVDRRLLNYVTVKYLTTHIVVVSEFLQKQIIEEWKIRAEKISTIHNMANVNLFLDIPVKRKRGVSDKKLTVTNVGRLSKQKAQHILLEAAQKVISKYPETKFMFVGQGELEQDLKQLTQSLNLEKNVEFMGIRRDVANILSESDIFVLSSFWEGLPLSAIEAMASACAVILTDVGGNRELIEHKKNGMIVPPGDSEALAGAIIELLEREDYRLSLGQAARARAIEKFDVALIVKQYEELYKRVWSESR